MSEQNEGRELFDVTEESFSALLEPDVTADADTPPEESSASNESVEVAPETDAESIEIESETQEESTEEPVEEVKQPEQTDESEPEKDKDLLVESNGKTFDFTNAPKEMREVVKTEVALTRAFVRDDIEKVQEKLKDLSPTSYANLEQKIVQHSAESAPDAWAEFLVKKDRQLVTDALLSSFVGENESLKGANPELLVELYRMYQEQSEIGEDLRLTVEARNESLVGEPKPKLTPEELAELQELRAEKQSKLQNNEEAEIGQTYSEVFDYVEETAVFPIVQELGFMPDKSDAPEVAARKEKVVNSLTDICHRALQSDPETADDYKLLLEKIKNRDKKGAMALLGSTSIIHKVEQEAMDYLGYIANTQTASLKQKHTPAKKPPVALAAAAAAPPAPPKSLTLAERLETADDDFYLRNMGIS